jgi:hypothetical protein
MSGTPIWDQLLEEWAHAQVPESAARRPQWVTRLVWALPGLLLIVIAVLALLLA